MLKKQVCLAVVPIILFLLCFMIFNIIFQNYVQQKTEQEFGTNVTYCTSEAGAFQPSNPLRMYSIWCTQNFDDLPMTTILTRAALKYLRLEWKKYQVLMPVHFYVIDKDNKQYYWSFRENKYIKR